MGSAGSCSISLHFLLIKLGGWVSSWSHRALHARERVTGGKGSSNPLLPHQAPVMGVTLAGWVGGLMTGIFLVSGFYCGTPSDVCGRHFSSPTPQSFSASMSYEFSETWFLSFSCQTGFHSFRRLSAKFSEFLATGKLSGIVHYPMGMDLNYLSAVLPALTW